MIHHEFAAAMPINSFMSDICCISPFSHIPIPCFEKETEAQGKVDRRRRKEKEMGYIRDG